MKQIILRALQEAGRRGAPAATADHIVLAIAHDPQSGGAIVLNQCHVPPQRLAAHLDSAAPADPTLNSISQQLDESALNLLRAAQAEADRLQHQHIGTEHIAIALADFPGPTAELAKQLGLTRAAAQAAALAWIKSGMPRPAARRRGFQPPGKLEKILRAPELAWKVYVRKSLGHPRFRTNPYPLYHWLRRRAPVRLDPLAPVWVVTRYEDVTSLTRDPRFRKDPFAAERLPAPAAAQLGADRDGFRVEMQSVSMLFLDPPQHTRVRATFTRQFTPATLAALRPRIELIASRRLDRLAGKDRFDLIPELAYPLPVIVIAELLGFPAEDYAQFKKWSDELTASLAINATPADHALAMQTRAQMRAYFDNLIPAFKADPTGPLLARLLSQENSPDGLTREEIFTNAVLLLAAGHETTTNLIGNGVLALMRNPDQWRRLVADPTLVESAVEEILRFDPPVQWLSRVAGEELELGGQTIPPDQIILGAIGAANRDPARFPNPDQFDITRPDNRHLAFGSGIHFCLGAALARMEAQIAIRLLMERYPRLRLSPGKLNWMPGLTFRGVTSLPLHAGGH